MNSLVVAAAAFVLYLIAYHTYGRFLSRKLFGLREDAPVPSREFQDDVDYLPTKKEVLFGHHFTSIAGTGPIVGPAIAIIWGWVPALLWVVLGSIFMGAVHDLGALVISARNQGKSIGEVSATLVNPRVRILFLLVIFFTLLIVLAAFAMIIALLFDMFPQAVFPVWMEIPIAVGLGYWVYRRGGSALIGGIVAVVLMYVTVVIGAYMPLKMPSILGFGPVTVWAIILFIYAYLASVLPVWKLLQPRDYINGHELFIALALLSIGVLWYHPPFSAPALNTSPAGAPPILPFVFITIACGAISGFHSLVSSGTSSKQMEKETDAQAIGYGSMLMEAVLATLVIVAVGAALGDKAAWQSHYANWAAAKGLGAKVGAFINGSANLLASYGIPHTVAITIMGVFVASFAGTTLDTAARIQRYIVTELATDYGVKPLTNRHASTLFAIITAAALAFAQGGGKGSLILWPLFGTSNQLLAALALLTITVYLAKSGRNSIYTFVPMLFMLTMTGWAMLHNIVNFWQNQQWHLLILGGILFVLALWMTIEAGVNYTATRSERSVEAVKAA